MIFLNEIVPNLTYSKKLHFLKYNWDFLDLLLLPYKFYGRDMLGIYFFIFASCELLKHYIFNGQSKRFVGKTKINFLEVSLACEIKQIFSV